MKTEDLSIGRNMRRLRDRADLTQEQVAAQLQTRGLNVSRTAYSNMERGLYNVSVSVLQALAIIYRVRINDFFEGLTVELENADL